LGRSSDWWIRYRREISISKGIFDGRYRSRWFECGFFGAGSKARWLGWIVRWLWCWLSRRRCSDWWILYRRVSEDCCAITRLGCRFRRRVLCRLFRRIWGRFRCGGLWCWSSRRRCSDWRILYRRVSEDCCAITRLGCRFRSRVLCRLFRRILGRFRCRVSRWLQCRIFGGLGCRFSRWLGCRISRRLCCRISRWLRCRILGRFRCRVSG